MPAGTAAQGLSTAAFKLHAPQPAATPTTATSVGTGSTAPPPAFKFGAAPVVSAAPAPAAANPAFQFGAAATATT